MENTRQADAPKRHLALRFRQMRVYRTLDSLPEPAHRPTPAAIAAGPLAGAELKKQLYGPKSDLEALPQIQSEIVAQIAAWNKA